MEPRFAEFFGDNAPVVEQYVDILLDRGIAWGLMGPREGDRLWQRHVLNSVAGAALISQRAVVVDVGSGAGLPGIPLALARPDLTITLLEPLARRAEFLRLAVDELGLGDQVRVVRARAEDHSERYDGVLSRAVAPLERLVGWCAPLMSADGAILALKGSSAADELVNCGRFLSRQKLRGLVHELGVPLLDEVTWVVEVRR